MCLFTNHSKDYNVSKINYSGKYIYNKKGMFKKRFQHIYRKLLEKGHEHLTVMFIPHSEKRIFNFQISNFALALVSATILILTIGGSIVYVKNSRLQHTVNTQAIQIVSSASKVKSFIDIVNPINSRTNNLDKVANELSELTGPKSISQSLQNMKPGIGGPISDKRLNISDKNKSNKMQEINQLKDIYSKLGFVTKKIGDVNTILRGHKAILQHIPSIFPVLGSSIGRGYVVSGFGWRKDPITYQMSEHTGLDIINIPMTPIVAAADGVVVDAKAGGGRGLYVELKHKFGYSTVYMHLSAFRVEAGQYVKKHQIIGQLGSTGRSTGPHLHYEVHINGVPIDPAPFIGLDRFRLLTR